LGLLLGNERISGIFYFSRIALIVLCVDVLKPCDWSNNVTIYSHFLLERKQQRLRLQIALHYVKPRKG